MITNCLGCKNYIRTLRDPDIHCLTEFSDECPCPECIIKMMCDLACFDFMKFREIYRRDNKGDTDDE